MIEWMKMIYQIIWGYKEVEVELDFEKKVSRSDLAVIISQNQGDWVLSSKHWVSFKPFEDFISYTFLGLMWKSKGISQVFDSILKKNASVRMQYKKQTKNLKI